MKTENRCSVRVYSSRRFDFRGRPCSKKATIQREGIWYCSIHDPITVEEKRRHRNEQWDKEYQEKLRIRKREQLEHAYCEGLTDEELIKGRAK
jgi:hypothetical protein